MEAPAQLPRRRPFIVVALLLAFAGFIIWSALTSGPVSVAVWSAPALLAAVGAFFRLRWAKWLVWATTVAITLAWTWTTIQYSPKGWYRNDPLSVAFSLIPATLLIGTWVGMSLALARPWRRRAA